MRMFVSVAALAVAVVCCSGCRGPAYPVAVSVIDVVAADLAAGKPDSAIASDVCAALGGSAATDAVCADVEKVVADAVAILLDTGVFKDQPAALGRARDYQTRHASAGK